MEELIMESLIPDLRIYRLLTAVLPRTALKTSQVTALVNAESLRRYEAGSGEGIMFDAGQVSRCLRDMREAGEVTRDVNGWRLSGRVARPVALPLPLTCGPAREVRA